MSLKIINTKSVVFRLVFSTTFLLLFSLILVTTVIYYLLSERMRENDRDYLERAAQSYSQVIQERGYKALKSYPDELILVIKKDGEVIHSVKPLDADEDDEEEFRELKSEALKLPLKKSFHTILLPSGKKHPDLSDKLENKLSQWAMEHNWVTLLSFIDNDMYEVLVTPVHEDLWLKIVRSSEDREEYLGEIRSLAGLVFLPFLILGIFLSFLLARGFLAPVKNLVKTIHEIKEGNSSARGIVRGVGDEMDVLTTEFNTLLDKNHLLIENLQSTVDSVAHDLRTPVTRFRTIAESALVSHPDDLNYLREALSEGMESTEKILKLLNAIMDVAEAKSQTMNIRQDQLSVSELIENVIDLYSVVAEEKQITIKADLHQKLLVKGDEIRLMQAFGNILDNAIKYSFANSEIFITAHADNDQVRVSFKDQGMGMEPHELNRIWDKLYRGDKSRSTQGLGLGLSLVKAIIEVHRGLVQVKSEPNKGSEFIISLPRCNEPVREM